MRHLLSKFPRCTIKQILPWATLFISFITIKWFSFYPRFSDGGVYLAMGKAITQGKIPYTDFFYSSPPLLPYLHAVLFWLFGPHWQPMTIVPIVVTLIDAVLIAYILKPVLRAPYLLLASTLYLFSTTILATTDYPSDVHIPLTLMLIAWLCISRQRPFVAGVLLGLATLCKLYLVLPLGVFALAFLLQKEWTSLRRVLLGWLAVFGSISLLCLAVLGKTYADATFWIHFAKPLGINKFSLWEFFLLGDGILLVGILLLPLIWKKIPTIPLLFLFFLPLFYAFFNDVYFLYFKLLIPALAILLVLALAELSAKTSRKIAKSIGVILLIASLGNASRYVLSLVEKATIPNLDYLIAEVQKATPNGEAMYGSNEIVPLLSVLANRPIAFNIIDTNSKFFTMGLITADQVSAVLAKKKIPLVIAKGSYTRADGKTTISIGQEAPKAYLKDSCKISSTVTLPNDFEDNALMLWTCGKKP